MSRLRLIVPLVAFCCIVGIEIQQVFACLCMCRGKSGAPTSVNVDDTGACDRDFSYTYTMHYATDSDNCGTGIGGTAKVYSNGAGSVNMQLHTISPTSFTISGAGYTQQFTVTGELANEDADGTSKTTAYDDDFRCVENTTVTIVKRPARNNSPPRELQFGRRV